MKIVSSAFVMAVLVTGTISAHTRDFCAAEVLEVQLFPAAPLEVLHPTVYGSWVATAILELRTSNALPWIVTLREKIPRRLVIRKGEIFRIPCAHASGEGLSITALATAAGYRSASARAGLYARVR
jgi:hypothetical protein